MATSKAPVKKSTSAIKRAHQGAKRHARNVSVLSKLKTEEKKLRSAIEAGTNEVKALFQTFTSSLDKAAKNGVIHKNMASRKKSRLNTRVSGPAKAAVVAKPKKVVKPKAAKAKAKLKPQKK
jgi:small subunit ribosomal protein S20